MGGGTRRRPNKTCSGHPKNQHILKIRVSFSPALPPAPALSFSFSVDPNFLELSPLTPSIPSLSFTPHPLPSGSSQRPPLLPDADGLHRCTAPFQALLYSLHSLLLMPPGNSLGFWVSLSWGFCSLLFCRLCSLSCLLPKMFIGRFWIFFFFSYFISKMCYVQIL